MSFAIIDDEDTQKYTNEEIIKIEDKAYNQALEDIYNNLADKFIWILEKYGDDTYLEVSNDIKKAMNELHR